MKNFVANDAKKKRISLYTLAISFKHIFSHLYLQASVLLDLSRRQINIPDESQYIYVKRLSI